MFVKACLLGMARSLRVTTLWQLRSETRRHQCLARSRPAAFPARIMEALRMSLAWPSNEACMTGVEFPCDLASNVTALSRYITVRKRYGCGLPCGMMWLVQNAEGDVKTISSVCSRLLTSDSCNSVAAPDPSGSRYSIMSTLPTHWREPWPHE